MFGKTFQEIKGTEPKGQRKRTLRSDSPLRDVASVLSHCDPRSNPAVMENRKSLDRAEHVLEGKISPGEKF